MDSATRTRLPPPSPGPSTPQPPPPQSPVGPPIRVTTRADVHLYGRRGGLLVRVPPRRRCVRHVCEPPRPGCPHGGVAHVHRARDRRGGKHRPGRQPYLDSRPHGTRDDDLVRAERSHGRHVRGLRLRLERGGLDVPVRARRRRVQRLQQPAELRRPDDKLTPSRSTQRTLRGTSTPRRPPSPGRFRRSARAGLPIGRSCAS